MLFQYEDQTGGLKKRLKEATLLQIVLLAAVMTAVIIISTGMGYIKVPFFLSAGGLGSLP